MTDKINDKDLKEHVAAMIKFHKLAAETNKKPQWDKYLTSSIAALEQIHQSLDKKLK